MLVHTLSKSIFSVCCTRIYIYIHIYIYIYLNIVGTWSAYDPFVPVYFITCPLWKYLYCKATFVALMTLRTLSISYGDSLMFSSLIYDNRVWYGPSCSMAFFVPVFATGSYWEQILKTVSFPGMREAHAAIRRRVLSTSFTCQAPPLAQLLPFWSMRTIFCGSQGSVPIISSVCCQIYCQRCCLTAVGQCPPDRHVWDDFRFHHYPK